VQITCSSCQKKFKLPPEKVPARRFSFTCPKCGNRIKVDPVQTEAMKIEELRPPASKDPDSVEITLAREAEESGAVPELPSSSPTFGDETLPATPAAAQEAPEPPRETEEIASLRPQDAELFATVPGTALVVHLGVEATRAHDSGLRALGFHEIEHLHSLEEAVTSLEDIEAGLLLVRMERCPAPPCEPLQPLRNLPFSTRRRTFVALEADNVKTLNGQVAFYLQVNALINRSDAHHLPRLLQRAMLYHLRLYQHWDLETD
jgi:DNA-directed RNA polymerase subunit RPC12/RpoP